MDGLSQVRKRAESVALKVAFCAQFLTCERPFIKVVPYKCYGLMNACLEMLLIRKNRIYNKQMENLPVASF